MVAISKPQPGQSNGVWGGIINAALDALTTAVNTAQLDAAAATTTANQAMAGISDATSAANAATTAAATNTGNITALQGMQYANTAWTTLGLATGFQNFTGGYTPGYKVVQGRAYLRGVISRTTGTYAFNTNYTLATLPTAARPTTRSVLRWGMSQFSTTAPPLVRIEIDTSGNLIVNATNVAGGTGPSWIYIDCDYEIM